jgi:hypothetical protein
VPVEVWQGLADRSHYDGPMTSLDGMVGVTHKITEGDHFYLDAEYRADAALVASLGAPVQGSYHVQHGGRSVTNQADWWFAQVDLLSPYWRAHPCWTWQDDAEKFDYMTAPTIAEINALGDAMCTRAQCPAERFIAYAPEWLYGSALRGLRYRQWESSYVSGSGPWRDLYPGNASVRWATAAVGGPLLLQYTSSAVIAGQTTCDASGYRGTLAQLLRDLRADSTGEIMALRFQFADDVPGRPSDADGVGNRVHVSNGASYHLVSPSGTWQTLLGKAGAGPIQVVTAASLGGANYDTAVAQLCGYLDTGKPADAVDAHAHNVTLTGATQTFSGKTGPAVAP